MITSAAIRATEASQKQNKKKRGNQTPEISSLKSRAKDLCCCCLLLPWGLDQFLPAFIFHIHATVKEVVKRKFQLYAVTEERLIFLNAFEVKRLLWGNCDFKPSPVSVVTGMNGPVVARHSAVVQQGLFTQLSERLAGRRQANWRLSAQAAVNDVNSA